MNGSWWRVYTRWRVRNFVGVAPGKIPDSWLYRIEYHDGRYWRTVYPWHLRFINQEAAEAELVKMGVSQEPFDPTTSKPTVKWWQP